MIEKAAEDLSPVYFLANENIDKGIGLFGAGVSAVPCHDFLTEKNHSVSCFVDNSPEKQKHPCCGLQVIPPSSFDGGVLFITNQTYAKAIEKSYAAHFAGAGRNTALITLRAFFTMRNMERFTRLRDNAFFDSESKNVLDTMIYENLTSENRFWHCISNKNQYFCLDELMDGANEVYVDIGAAVGDTIERFIWEKNGYISRIYAFEPSPREYEALKYRMERLTREWMFSENQIIMVKAGIGEKTGKRILQSNKLGTNNFILNSWDTVQNNAEGDRIDIYCMDDYFRDVPVTFIKADVEGYEMRCLRGASAVIKRDKPKMALCIYHKPEDIFDFTKYISSIVPEYKFKLRHHSRNWTETVLYAFVEI
jgi:FkbM family methyltransferase